MDGSKRCCSSRSQSNFFLKIKSMTKKDYLKQVEQEKEELSLDKSLGEEEVYVCYECGSLDIEEKYWVGTNDGIVSDYCDTQEYFCNTCEQKFNGYPYSVERFTKEKCDDN